MGPMLQIHAERAGDAVQGRMSVDDIATLAYWQLIFGEQDEEMARLRVLGLCAAVIGEFEDCFPDARPVQLGLSEQAALLAVRPCLCDFPGGAPHLSTDHHPRLAKP